MSLEARLKRLERIIAPDDEVTEIIFSIAGTDKCYHQKLIGGKWTELTGDNGYEHRDQNKQNRESF